MKKRLFFSIPVTETEKAAFVDAVPNMSGIKKVRPDLYHLTIAFLGDTEEALVEPIGMAVEESLRGFGSFSLPFKQIRLIPEQSERAHMVWAEYETTDVYCDLLQRIQAAVGPLHRQFAMKISSVPKEPVAHVTLARMKQTGALARTELKQMAGLPSLEISSVELMESELTDDGPSYQVRKQIALT